MKKTINEILEKTVKIYEMYGNYNYSNKLRKLRCILLENGIKTNDDLILKLRKINETK